MSDRVVRVAAIDTANCGTILSPDGAHVRVAVRDPEPVTMPHVAVGETPGIAGSME